MNNDDILKISKQLEENDLILLLGYWMNAHDVSEMQSTITYPCGTKERYEVSRISKIEEEEK